MHCSSQRTTVILQNNFDILLGSIEITVPWVVDGTDYSIIRVCFRFLSSECLVLMYVCGLEVLGDASNDSQDFTITGSGISF